jgi:hypothetical protein
MATKSEPGLRNKTKSTKRGGRRRSAELERPHSGGELVKVMQTSPLRDIDIEPWRGPLPVRDVKL